MATYDELLTLATTSTGSALASRIQVAAVIAANKIAVEPDATTNHANRLKWAKSVFQNSSQASRDLLWCVLAKNQAATSVQIAGASDALIQTNVDLAVDILAQG